MYDDPPNDSSSHASLLPLYMGLAFLGTLAIGLILGFLARPFIIPDQVEVVEVVATAAISEPQTVAQAQPSQPATKVESPADSDAVEASESQSQSASEGKAETSVQANPDAAPTPTIMDFLMSDARHILGAEDAPVTIIEFSDFR